MPHMYVQYAHAYVCVFTLSRRLHFMRDFVILDKIQRNMRWHLDFVPWVWETFSFASQCTFRHDETWTKYAYNCVCLCVCAGAGVCLRVLTHLTNVLKTNSVSFTVDGKSLFSTRVFLMHISCSFRIVSFCFGGVGGQTNHKHVKSIRVK